jgi:hypothetical protein
MLAYQVCEWTRSAPAQSSTIARSTPSVRMAGLAPSRDEGSAYAVVPASERGAPKQRTRASISGRTRSARTSSATCTPAPP